jgi:hypothetical protein
VNDDRCAHVPTSPGQRICTCLDRRMFLELLVELQARRIVELEREAQRHEPRLLQIPAVPLSDTHEERPVS